MHRLVAVLCGALLLTACDDVKIKSSPTTHPIGETLAAQDVPERSNIPLVTDPVGGSPALQSDENVMPSSKDRCRKIEEGYCIYNTGWTPTRPNSYLEPLSAEETDTDGAGCVATDSRGNQVAMVAQDGPIVIRYNGVLRRLGVVSKSMGDNLYGKYESDNHQQTIVFNVGDETAVGLENRTNKADLILTVSGSTLSTEVSLECGA